MEQHIEIIDRHGRKRRARPGEMLQDGERFNMPFMDAEMREVADALAQRYGRFHTCFSDGTPDHTNPHQKGFRFADTNDEAKNAADAAYEERNKRLANAWRTKQPDAGNDLTAPAAQEAAWLRRQALARKATVESMGTDAADAAYEARSKRMRDAWKHD